MLRKLKSFAKPFVPSAIRRALAPPINQSKLLHANPGSWMATNLKPVPDSYKHESLFATIEDLARQTQALGPQPIWDGFATVRNYPTSTTGERTSEQVRTDAAIGRLYTYIVTQKKPRLVVEFGTAFGVSGMYWLAGLELNKMGHMITFEPNEAWAEIANSNLAKISQRYDLVRGTFEDRISVVDSCADQIDLAFIDAIHTSEFVFKQLELVKKRCAPGALIFLDDIRFSPDMTSCWNAICNQKDYAAAAELENRVGLIELRV